MSQIEIFRCSYSMLSVWAHGDYDRALQMYFKRSSFDTEAMAFGRAMHTEWENEVKSTGRMPAIFGGKVLPPGYKAEVFLRKMLTPWLELRGKLDLYTPPAPQAEPELGATLGDQLAGITPTHNQSVNNLVAGSAVGFDWKTGSTSSTQYGNSYQHRTYKVLLPFLERFEYHAYNQYTREKTVSIVHLTQQMLDEGVEWVVTNASEMKMYIEQNNLVEVFAAMPKVERVKR